MSKATKPARDKRLEDALRAFYDDGIIEPSSPLTQHLARLGLVKSCPQISRSTYAITPAGKELLEAWDDDDWTAIGEGYPPMDSSMSKELYARACAAFDVLAPVHEGDRAFTGSLGVGLGPLSLGDGYGEVLVWGNETYPRVEQVWRIAQMVTAAVLKENAP